MSVVCVVSSKDIIILWLLMASAVLKNMGVMSRSVIRVTSVIRVMSVTCVMTYLSLE